MTRYASNSFGVTRTQNPTTETLTVTASDAPTAFGRKPSKGDIEWALRVPLDDGRLLIVKVGDNGFKTILGLHENPEEVEVKV